MKGLGQCLDNLSRDPEAGSVWCAWGPKSLVMNEAGERRAREHRALGVLNEETALWPAEDGMDMVWFPIWKGHALGGQWIGVGLAVRREARKSCQEAAALQGKDNSGLH